MPAWAKCDKCRKVKPGEDFDEASPTCRVCLTAPVRATPKARAGSVTTRRTTPKAPPAEPGPRQPLLGVAGSGDLEVRERRARRTALDQLAETHPLDFQALLTQARRNEGLRT